MSEFPDTRESLLVRVQEADRDAWYEFAAIYRPVVYRLARRRGLQDADAQDLAQRVLLSAAKAIQGWQPDDARAKFRTWLSTIIRNQIIDELRRRRPDEARGGTTVMARLADIDDPAPTQEIEREYRRQVFRRAAQAIRDEFSEKTWLAFWQTTVEGKAVAAVASELQTSIGSVYTARSRVMRRLVDQVQQHCQD